VALPLNRRQLLAGVAAVVAARLAPPAPVEPLEPIWTGLDVGRADASYYTLIQFAEDEIRKVTGISAELFGGSLGEYTSVILRQEEVKLYDRPRQK
jgi:hypothetical protein